MKELDKEAIAEQQEETYLSIREYIISAQNKVKSAVNHAMVNAYWKIGDNSPIGILLCADKGDTLVRYTLQVQRFQNNRT